MAMSNPVEKEIEPRVAPCAHICAMGYGFILGFGSGG